MVDSPVTRRFWVLPSVAIGAIFLFAQLPLYSPIAPSHWLDTIRDSYTNIYDVGGYNLGLHFGWWWVLWLIALVLALGFVFLKSRVGASVALAFSFLPVLASSIDWLKWTADSLGQGALDYVAIWDMWFPTFAWWIVIVGYAYAIVGIARMRTAAAPVVAPSGKMNVFAVLALVIGILGGWLAIVFGHLALSQIKNTGQKGREMATFGLVLGYIWVPVNIAIVILLIAYSSS